MIFLQIDTNSPLRFMDLPEHNLAADHQLTLKQLGMEGKREKKHKKKKDKKHVIEVQMAELEQEQVLGVDQEQGEEERMSRKKKKKEKKQHKHMTEDYSPSTDVKRKEEKNRKESKPENHMPEERKKKAKSHCDYRSQCETVAAGGDDAETSKPEDLVSEQTPQHRTKKKKRREKSLDHAELSTHSETVAGGGENAEVSKPEMMASEQTPRERMKKKKRREKSLDHAELSTHGETEDGTEGSQQGEEVPQKKKRKKGKRSIVETDLDIQGPTEDGTESSQWKEESPEPIQLEMKKRGKKRHDSSCDQTEERKVETESDSEASQRRGEIPERDPQGGLQVRKRKSIHGLTELSIQSEMEDGKESCNLTESSLQVETVAGVKDGAKATRQGGISNRVPTEKKRPKNKRGEKSSGQKQSSSWQEIPPEVFTDELADQTLDIEKWGEHWEVEKMKYMDELKEFIPGVVKKSTRSVYRLIKYDLLRFREFKKAGVCLKRGRYSSEEVKKLKKNVEDFLALTGIDSGAKLFFPSRFPEEKRNITQMKNKYMFHLRMSDGISRPWHDIYSKGRKLFDNYKMGRFTDEELHSLQKLHQLHGNKWMKISELTERSSSALEKRFSQMSKNKGPWTESELQMLEGAIRDHLVTLATPGANGPTVRRDQLYSNLPWADVAHKMGTRSWDKCRSKWMSILNKRLARGTEDKSTSCDSMQKNIRLIRTLYSLEIEDAADINWEDLTKIFGDVTPHFVQIKFHRLKVRWVPQWQALSFGEISDFLFEKALPQLEEKLRVRLGDAEREMEDLSTQQESFLLSEIFSD